LVSELGLHDELLCTTMPHSYLEPEVHIEALENEMKEKLPPLTESVESIKAGLEESNTRTTKLEETIGPDFQEDMTYLFRKIEELEHTCATLMKANAGEGNGWGLRKVPPPPPKTYGGGRDPKEVDNFIFDVEQYFRVTQLEPTLQVDTAAMYLTDDAKLWWRTKYSEKEA